MRFAIALLFAFAACVKPPTENEAAKKHESENANASKATNPPVSAPASASASAPALPAPRLSSADEAKLDAAVRGAIDRAEVPGAVLLLIREGKVVFRRAYGLRAKEPAPSPMSLDTIFDLASLTKPVATASSILLLIDRKTLKLSDPVRQWLPDFQGEGREKVTIQHLLQHTSGLPAGDAISNYTGTRAQMIARVLKTPLQKAPGEAYVYSDLGYLLLGEIVERASGEPLDRFSKKNVFEPLGMRDTTFRPDPSLVWRFAPTEKADGKMLLGEVHDPRARALSGVAGHAGLFSTAEDLARFVLALLPSGEGPRLFSEQMSQAILDLQPIDEKERRSLALTSLFDAAGHTGFTGTAFWLDPRRGDAVILLASRLHPDGKGDVKRLRRDVAHAAATIHLKEPEKAATAVRVGVDTLEDQGFALLEGRKIGLITNHTGKDARGERTIDVLLQSKKLSLVALFTPEHGLSGQKDEAIADGKDAKTGLPIHSLYGQDKRPTDAELSGIDTLVFDIQDAGTRFYTYISTLGIMLEEAAKRKLRFVVLDRPNPLGGVVMEGPLLDPGRESFVGYHSIPIRHGLTVGEWAGLFRAEKKLDVDLQVVRMSGWKRDLLWEKTGLLWVNPSPNLRSPLEALLYPGVGLLETTNVSVGRGTEKPFERIGAPYLDGPRLAAALENEKLAGLRFTAIRFKPTQSTFAGEECSGVAIEVKDPAATEPVKLGFTIAVALHKLYPNQWKSAGLLTLLGNARTFAALSRGEDARELSALAEDDLRAFENRRKPFLLYP